MIIKNEIPQVHLGEYDINVKTYLTYSQIQQIVDNYQVLEKLKSDDGRKYDYWAARQQHIDMALLLNVTDISEEDLRKVSHDQFLFNGVIDKVKECVVNYNQLIEAFDYSEAWDKTLAKIVDSFTNVLKVNKYDIKKISQDLKELHDGNTRANE